MRPKDFTEDITQLINNTETQITYASNPDELIEYLDEYAEFISELLIEFRNDRVYVIDMPAACIFHPEGLSRLVIEESLDSNIIDTPINRSIMVSHQFMHSFERLKMRLRQELDLNREVFIYSIAPFRYQTPNGEIQYRPSIRWSMIPLEIWYNNTPLSLNPLITKRLIKKHKM